MVERDLSWAWKDEDNWVTAKESGALDDVTITGVEDAKSEVLERVQGGLGDLMALVDWVPDPTWAPPRMPANWDRL